ncbi:hydrogenase expression/formation protein HypE [Candidatus Sumerlaeota bacterium]|nr:hydrogenase expression/formation protein HypE [Candidatus Sumerlaeota bacterium]
MMSLDLSCPLPISDYPQVVLAHGGGGSLTAQLIDKMFGPAFSNPLLDARHDGAVFESHGGRLAFTTDSHVVTPLFFPGGDIGSLSVNGTVNDLAMCGARPLHLSAGFILEEGFPMEALWRIVQSMRRAAEVAQVQIVTGDTKVVDRGKGDGVFITTSGVGVIEHGLTIAPSEVRPGDVVILSGDIGRHGVAILTARESLAFETTVESDCASLAAPTLGLLEAGVEVHCLRDLTRGGLATAAVEIAETSGLRIDLEETAIPVLDGVRGACEILGLDPLYMANEGRLVAFVRAEDAARAIEVLRSHPVGRQSSVIGSVAEGDRGLVTLRTGLGTSRIVTMLSGEQLPRIC